MTEYERLAIKHGWATTVNDEIICDYNVTKKLRKIQLIGLDLLWEFDSLCKKNNLKYFIMFGTLLGAIRHGGFIPWDDDIDVAMPRDDYEKLMQMDPNIMGEPYFFQFPGKDNGYYMTFARLRNSNTSGISRAFINEEFNQGLFIDIFPYDNCCENDVETNYHAIKELILEESTHMRRSLKKPLEIDIKRMNFYPIRDKEVVFDEIDSIVKKYNNMQTDYVGFLTVTVYPIKKMIFERFLFDDLEEIQFENIIVKAPNSLYRHRILEILYGNYMELPPIEKRFHSLMNKNPDIPYKILINEIRGGDSNEWFNC